MKSLFMVMWLFMFGLLVAVPQASSQVDGLILQGVKHHLAVSPELLHRFGRNDGSGENRGSRTVANTGSGKPSAYNDDIELWLNSHFIEGENESAISESYFVQFGADYSIGKDIIIGIIGEYDNKNFKQGTATNASEVDIEGWNAKSFIVGNISQYNLNVESGASYGAGEIVCTGMGGGCSASPFETERLGFSAALSADFQRSSLIFTPRVSYNYFSTKRDDNDVELELNQLGAGLVASSDVKIGGVVFAPSFGFGGIYDSASGGGIDENTLTGRLNGGLYFYGRNGVNWHIGGHYDVVSDDKDLQTFAISSGLNVRF